MNAQAIKERIDKSKQDKIQIYPCRNLRASNIGHPCERYLYLLVKNWQDQKPADITLQCIFDLGNKMEEYAIQTLKEAGLEIITPAVRSWQIDDPFITGREDILLKDVDTGELIPGEIKGISPFEFDKLNSIEDFLSSRKYYIRAYPMQLLTYMWKFEKEHGLFIIVNKLTGEVKPIDLFLKDHTNLMLQMLEKATRVNKAIAENNIPDAIDDNSVCEVCPLSHICGHSTTIPLDVEVDDELEDLINEKESLKETKKKYEELDDEIKAKVGEREKVLAGTYLITRTKTVKPAHTEPAKEIPEKVTWRMNIKKIAKEEK